MRQWGRKSIADSSDPYSRWQEVKDVSRQYPSTHLSIEVIPLRLQLDETLKTPQVIGECMIMPLVGLVIESPGTGLDKSLSPYQCVVLV
jgi:hypothetical protein